MHDEKTPGVGQKVYLLTVLAGLGLTMNLSSCQLLRPSLEVSTALPVVELVRLSEANWDEYAPLGKEVDAIYGDYVLRNDRLIAVVANPIASRHASMRTRNVGGGLIDLTRRDVQSDQLSALYPWTQELPLRSATIVSANGKQAVLVCQTVTEQGKPTAEVRYTLEAGWDWILVETVLTNTTAEPLTMDLRDEVRAEQTFTAGSDGTGSLVWVDDKWFGQAYGFVPEGHQVSHSRRARGDKLLFRNMNPHQLRYTAEETQGVTLQPGAAYTLRRRVICAVDALQVRSVANTLRGISQSQIHLLTVDPSGPVAGADVDVSVDTQTYGTGRTDADGVLDFSLPLGQYNVKVSALGRTSQSLQLDATSDAQPRIELDAPGYVAAQITDEQGGPIPCKVQFIGRDGTADPFFFPPQGEHAVMNVYYSQNGAFRQALPPGKYDVVISYGPEYDAVFTSLEARRGVDTPLRAKLIRTVDTNGWVSADFHSHSSPSGDNTSSQYGRVLNLLCEHIEFAPCTEHNRLSTYVPHLRRLQAEHLMATTTGIELTSSPGSVTHANAFPLILKPHIQDGGAQAANRSGALRPEEHLVQIERLALWDNGSEKIVQQNHPNIIRLLFDEDLDGQPDAGYRKQLAYMDVIEVEPLHNILEPPAVEEGLNTGGNRIHSWLQMLNQGYRVPGVANTDSHYNFHGSGWLRNYIKSPTDDPARIKTLDIVHETERGHIILTNGPFLQVNLQPADGSGEPAIAGDELVVQGGHATLHVRVQCPNWFDIDRIQVFLNGRPDPQLNFTRKTTADRFSDRVVKFDQTIQLELKEDTHVIVVAVGENSEVIGENQAMVTPIAISNPIYVDVDGQGFQPNGDTLDAPLPVE